MDQDRCLHVLHGRTGPLPVRPIIGASMDFTIEQDIPAPLADVERWLLDADFITASSDLPKLSDCRLLDLTEAGNRVEARIHRRFDDHLSPAVTAVIDPAKLTWVEEVEYDLDTHVGRCTFVPEFYGNKFSAEYRSTLEPTASGGTLRVARGQLSVKAFLASRTVERAIVSGLSEYSQAEAELLGSWTPTSP